MNAVCRRKYFNSDRVIKITSFLIMAVFTLIMLVPVVFMVLYSFFPTADVNTVMEGANIFKSASLEGYRDVFRQTPFLKMAYNSLWLSVVQTLLQLIMAFFTAYAITRWKYPKRDLIFKFIIATMIIPTVAVMIPNYIIINKMGLVGNKWGVVLPFIASGYAIFLMRQFFKSMPESIVEAAMIDGCSEFQILFKIYLPMMLPAIAALTIILFVGHWNDYQWPLMVLSKPESMTLPLALVRFENEGIIEWMPTAAACVMTMLLPLILFLITQKAFVETFADSAVKG